jgi:alpha-beta hydrolase superfamily lysophospholipase
MEKTFLLSHEELNIFCRQSQPDRGEIWQVVLGVHGLNGSSEDEIQVDVAEEMEIFSSATIRFDFPVHGQSPMTDEFFTLENCRQSLLAAAEYAKQQYPEVEDLCIFATGFGAYMVLICLEELVQLPGKIRLVVQTPSVMMHETLLSMKSISRPTFQAMGEITFSRRRPLTVKYSFYEDLVQNVALTTHPIPMLILHGEFDDYIPREYIQHLRRLNEDAKLVIIPGASHRFLEEGAWDMVLDLTRDWFEYEQVLLSDWS